MEEIDYEDEEELEEDDGKKKKRRKIFFWILFGVVIVGIILLILTLTMCRKTRNVDVEVVYDDRGVDAFVTSSYMLTPSTLSQVGDKLDFYSGSETPQNPTVNMPAITLNKDNNYTIFEYSFQNLGDEQMTVSIDDSHMTKNNVKITYLVQEDKLNISNDGHLEIDRDSFTTVRLNPADYAYSLVYVYVKVEIADFAKDAEYSGSLYWILSPVTE